MGGLSPHPQNWEGCVHCVHPRGSAPYSMIWDCITGDSAAITLMTCTELGQHLLTAEAENVLEDNLSVSIMIIPSFFLSFFLHSGEIFCHFCLFLANLGCFQFTSTITTALLVALMVIKYGHCMFCTHCCWIPESSFTKFRFQDMTQIPEKI